MKNTKPCKKVSSKKTEKPAATALAVTKPIRLTETSIVGRWIGLNLAAEILQHHLGESLDHWREYLSKDAADSLCIGIDEEPMDTDFSWSNRDRLPYCDASGLYKYIAYKNPKSLGIYALELPQSVSPYELDFSVSPYIDYENGGRLLVKNCSQEGREDTTLLTAREARKLAGRLLLSAKFCETHSYNYFLGIQKSGDLLKAA